MRNRFLHRAEFIGPLSYDTLRALTLMEWNLGHRTENLTALPPRNSFNPHS